MWAKEPFDLRLTVLRMIRNLHIIIGVTLLGVLLFGGGYYVKCVLLNQNTTYEAISTYRVSYVEEPSKSGDYYINEMTWNTYVDSKEFADAVYAYLMEMVDARDDELVKSAEELAGILDARLDSDVHVPSTVVTTTSEERTLMIAQAVERAMTQDFVEKNEQVAAIEVITPALRTQEVVPDVRPLRAVVLSAVLSFFFVVVLLLFKEISDSAVWLPATLRKRYGLKVLGTVESPELLANLEFVFGDSKKIAVCAIDSEVNPAEVIDALREKWSKQTIKEQMQEWISVPAPMLCPESSKAMHETEGVLLVIKAGKCAEKTLEYILEYLITQEIKVTAALLWDADEWLIRMYYGKVLV